MDFINNVLDLNYQSWKRTINQMVLYKYFKEEAEKKNKILQNKMSGYTNLNDAGQQYLEEYTNLLNQLFENSTGIYKKVQENLENQELLQQIYEEKNIDVSEASYNRWMKTGEKIKI